MTKTAVSVPEELVGSSFLREFLDILSCHKRASLHAIKAETLKRVICSSDGQFNTLLEVVTTDTRLARRCRRGITEEAQLFDQFGDSVALRR
jgi:hypothetical protein